MHALDARLHAVEYLAEGILAFDIRPKDSGAAWPAAVAGAHIEIRLPNGLARCYSLVNPGDATHRYVVAVQQAAGGRGGSRYLHESARVGQPLLVSEPRNFFPLNETAEHTVLIGGGIGVTPLWAMAQRLSALGKPWTFYHCARHAAVAAYGDDIAALAERTGNHVHRHFDEGVADRMLDLQAVVASLPSAWHVYGCGPEPMLKAFEAACAGRDPSTVHREYFSAPAAEHGSTTDRAGFEVILARAKKRVFVAASQTILDAVLDAGVDVPHSCLAGVCRSCEVTVLDGVPDHQDVALTEQERAAGRSMLLCCSRSKTPELTLDL